MTTISVAASGKANQVAAEFFGDNRKNLRSSEIVLAVARRLWPRKTAEEIAARTRYSVRAAEYWLALTHDMPFDAYMALLNSDHGSAFLDAVYAAMSRKQAQAFSKKIREAERAKLLAELSRQRDEIEDL